MMIVGPGFPPLWSWNSYKEPWEQISFKVSATHSASPFRDALFSELFMDEWIGLREGPVWSSTECLIRSHAIFPGILNDRPD